MSTHTGTADVIVVGAGHNALISACYLAREGLDVLVLEASDRIGGCTTTGRFIQEAPDHLINPCAVDILLLRASNVVEDLQLRRFGWRDRELNPSYMALDPDGASIAFWDDPRQTADEIRRLSRADAAAYLEFISEIDAALDVMLPLMLTNPQRPAPKALLQAAKGGRHPRKLANMASMFTASAAEAIDERFTHPLLRGAMGLFVAIATSPTAEGSASTLAALGMVHRVGSCRMIGGTQTLPDSLATCLAAHRGRIRTDARVDSLLTSGGRVTGVQLRGGEQLSARCVLAGCDPRQTLTHLLPDGVLSQKLQARAAAIPTKSLRSAHLKVDMAFGAQLSLPAHAAWRGDGLDLRKPAALIGTLEQAVNAYDEAARGRLGEPQPFAVVLPAAVDPSQVPEGGETAYLWTGSAPADPVDGWAALKQPASQVLVDRFKELYSGVEEHELGRFVETPIEIAQRTNSPDGNPYHVDFTLLRSGPLRPALGFAGYRTPVPGLFLTGAGTHPGPSVSGIAGQLAAKEVLRELKRSGPVAPPRAPVAPAPAVSEPEEMAVR